ncbi:complement C1q-like protein 4 [Ruditapes philippinarum]|uniref:complement C1q-like protein 4 n=1 Tax=Ruditapes philippinarum TaxID=129788 RepID=UPI00295A8F18|nr:complement C1q-like protein 4 [Ruditapes philippinarum]
MMAVYKCIILTLASFTYCYAVLDSETFQNTVLDKLETLDNKIALQKVVIDNQQSILHSLLTGSFQAYDERKVDGIDRKERFLLDGNEGPVAFTAAINARVVEHVGLNETVKFDTVITNVGNGFDNTTGVFTAPLPGIYMFSCSLLDHMDGVHGNVKLHAEIVQNDKVIGRVFAHAGDNYRDQGAQTVFVRVNQGDRIFIRSVDNKDLGIGGELYSTFSGFLMSQL